MPGPGENLDDVFEIQEGTANVTAGLMADNLPAYGS